MLALQLHALNSASNYRRSEKVWPEVTLWWIGRWRLLENCSKFLIKSFIISSSKSLADLAAWEPKSFESLAMIARERAAQDGLRGLHEKEADNRVVYYTDEQKKEKEKYDGVQPANYTAWFREKIY